MRINVSESKADIAKRQALIHEQRMKEDNKLRVRLRFIQNTDLKGHYCRLNHQVDLALKAVDDDLEKKRNHLRAKLLEDESCLTFEYVDKAQQYAERLFQEKKRKAERIVEAYEKDRLDFVDEMVRKQKVLNCDELRTIASIDRRKVISKVHLLQMKEKELLKAKEKDLDDMYHNLMVTDCKYDFENAELHKRIALRAQQDQDIKRQIIAHEYAKAETEALKQDEAVALKEYNKKLAEADRLQMERECRDKMNLKNMLLEQIRLYHELKDKRDSYEKEIDRIILEELMRETAQIVQTGLENKLLLSNELKLYKQAWEELNDFKQNLNLNDELAINHAKEQKVNEVKKFEKQVKQDKINFIKEQDSTWEKQIKQRLDRKQMARETSEAERELYETCLSDIDNARRRQTKDDALKFQSDLMEQMKYNELVQKRENEDLKKLENSVVQGYEQRMIECAKMNYNLRSVDHPFFKTLVSCRKKN